MIFVCLSTIEYVYASLAIVVYLSVSWHLSVCVRGAVLQMIYRGC